MSRIRSAAAAAAVAASLASPPAAAQRNEAAPEGLLQLQASVTAEVAQDVMSLVLGATRDGTDAASVQAALRQALDAALAEARRIARPGQVEVRTGNFSLFPRHGSKGAITGWQGQTELIVEGKDMAAIAQLAGRIQTLTVSRVGYALSREQREKAEADVAAQAIARFRARAGDYAKAFGYGSMVLREVQVSTDAAPPPMPMVRARTMAVEAADAGLPVEAGKGTVTVNVSGTVQMVK
jgi:predicted secreted protein